MFLECLDRAVAEAGLTRGTGADVKSSVRLVGDGTALLAFEENESRLVHIKKSEV